MRRGWNGYLFDVRLRRANVRALLAGATLLLGAGLAAAIVGVTHEGSGPPATASETVSADTRPSVNRRVLLVGSARAFTEAVEHARSGETIVASGDFRIPGEFKGFDRVVAGGGSVD